MYWLGGLDPQREIFGAADRLSDPPSIDTCRVYTEAYTPGVASQLECRIVHYQNVYRQAMGV
jgi:hypothetical protein